MEFLDLIQGVRTTQIPFCNGIYVFEVLGFSEAHSAMG